jgi:hypothetical protein
MEHREEYRSSKDEEKPEYKLKYLKDFLATKNYYITHQFISEGVIMFIKVHIESVGENILIYFPSSYDVPQDHGLNFTEIVSYDLTEKDILSFYQSEDQDENYSELRIDDTDTMFGHGESYKPIIIANNQENDIRKKMVRYIEQLNKFRTCTEPIKYKFAILTEEVLCTINRHNTTDSYIVKNGKGLIPVLMDSKTDIVQKIDQEFFIVIDLPSFYEKINQVPDDVIKLYKNFYYILNKVHTKQTAIAEHRFKNYQIMINKMLLEYNKKHKYLDMLQTLIAALEKNRSQEANIRQRISIFESQRESGIVKETEKTFKLSKTEQELKNVLNIKEKIIKTIYEVKTKYHDFLLTFDSVISETTQGLKKIEDNIKRLNLTFGRK